MTEKERLRFYLRDPSGASQFFSDDELDELLDSTDSFEQAVGLGWMVKASAAATDTTTAGAVTSRTIGKISETYSTGGTESSASTAFAMAYYWFSRAPTAGSRWLEMVPAEGFISETIEIAKALKESDQSLAYLFS